MSLKGLHEAVMFTAQKAYQQKNTADIVNMANATFLMAQSYAMMKEVEIHEKFHLDQEELIPGEEDNYMN